MRLAGSSEPRERGPNYEPWLLETVRANLPALAADPTLRVKRIATRRLKYSVIEEWLASGAGAEQRLIVKRFGAHLLDAYLQGEAAERHLRGEYEALATLWPIFHAESGLAVPRPLGYLVGDTVLVMEKVPGTPLLEALRLFPLIGSARVARAVERCGVWLATLHNATEVDLSPAESLDRALEELERSATNCARLGLPPSLLSAAVRYARRCAPTAIARGAVAGSHGDFNSSNVLVHGEALTVLDFTYYQNGSVFHDPAYFLGMLERHLGPRPTGALRRRFLDGYRRHRPLDPDALNCFRVAQKLRIAEWDHGPPKRWDVRGALRWRAELRRLTAWLHRHVPHS